MDDNSLLFFLSHPLNLPGALLCGVQVRSAIDLLFSRGSLTGFVAIVLMTTMIPLVIVITVVVKEKAVAYTEILTPPISYNTYVYIS